MGKVVAELKIVPLGTGSPSVSSDVARGLNALRKTGIKMTIGPGSTTLEGSLKDVLKAVEVAHNSLFSEKVFRVSTSLTIDERRDKTLTAAGKIKSVKAKLRKLK